MSTVYSIEQIELMQNFIDIQIARLRARGWNESYANQGMVSKGDGFQPDYFYIYAVRDVDGERETLESIYGSIYNLETQEQREALADRILTKTPHYTQYKVKTLLELVSKAQDLAKDLEVPSDFINPLLAMADQLRKNILTFNTEE
jgi:hypothetical protein